jgi:apolipoprotein D and lipocalin family protein
MIIKVFIFLIGCQLAAFIYPQKKEPVTVKYVDLKKYSGLWYEIAKIPNSFQDQCIKDTKAQYKITEDGEISVLNSCIDEDGEIDEADGIARVVDRKTNSKLEVSFVSFLGWRPFWGDYWIIGLDENYQWAVVGTPDRKYGWILSRSQKLDAGTREKINIILKEQGYNPKDFVTEGN